MGRLPIDMHENPGRGNKGDVVFHSTGSHVATVGIDAVGHLGLPVILQGDTPAVHAVFPPCQRLSLRIIGGKVTKVLGEIQNLIVPRCPYGHVQHQFLTVVPVLCRVVEPDIQIVVHRVESDGVM